MARLLLPSRVEACQYPLYRLMTCLSAIALFLFIIPTMIWLSLFAANQSLITFSIGDFYIAGIDSTDASNFNQSVMYFKLDIANNDQAMGIYYDNLNLTFSYYASADNIVPVANYTIQGFRQGVGRQTDRKDYVVMNRGITWQDISNNVSVLSLSPTVSTDVVFRVDLASAVRFREFHTGMQSKRLKIMAWHKVEVDRIAGKKVDRKAIELKHMIKNHTSVWVIFGMLIMGILSIVSPCFGYFCVAGYYKLIGEEPVITKREIYV